MSNRWKLKASSSNILLVLILVKAEWTKGETDNSFDYGNSIDKTKDETIGDQASIYVGNDDIANYFFGSSSKENSTILGGINKCLENFQLMTCVKMLLLDRINDAVGLMEEPSVRDADVRFLNGLLVFKIKNETKESGPSDISDELSLDEEITAKVRRIFWGRSLLVKVLPSVQIEIEPARGKLSDFVCFSYTVRRELESREEDEQNENESRGRKNKRKGEENKGVINEKTNGVTGNGNNGGKTPAAVKGNQGGKRKRKKGGGGMPMMTFIPQILMLGLMPFTLASLKAMVMNAVMVNMMALNGAIFMTIRNLVFGPRQGDNVQYVNYGYSKDKGPKKRRPALIIHSPAAFVKQPPVPEKHFYGPHHNFHGNGDSYHVYHNGNSGNHREHEVEHHFNPYHGEPAEIVDVDLTGHGDENSDELYYVVPKDQNRRRWQEDRNTYRPRKVSHLLKIKRKN